MTDTRVKLHESVKKLFDDWAEELGLVSPSGTQDEEKAMNSIIETIYYKLNEALACQKKKE